jgi:hypothetical protein
MLNLLHPQMHFLHHSGPSCQCRPLLLQPLAAVSLPASLLPRPPQRHSRKALVRLTGTLCLLNLCHCFAHFRLAFMLRRENDLAWVRMQAPPLHRLWRRPVASCQSVSGPSSPRCGVAFQRPSAVMPAACCKTLVKVPPSHICAPILTLAGHCFGDRLCPQFPTGHHARSFPGDPPQAICLTLRRVHSVPPGLPRHAPLYRFPMILWFQCCCAGFGHCAGCRKLHWRLCVQHCQRQRPGRGTVGLWWPTHSTPWRLPQEA